MTATARMFHCPQSCHWTFSMQWQSQVPAVSVTAPIIPSYLQHHFSSDIVSQTPVLSALVLHNNKGFSRHFMRSACCGDWAAVFNDSITESRVRGVEYERNFYEPAFR